MMVPIQDINIPMINHLATLACVFNRHGDIYDEAVETANKANPRWRDDYFEMYVDSEDDYMDEEVYLSRLPCFAKVVKPFTTDANLSIPIFEDLLIGTYFDAENDVWKGVSTSGLVCSGNSLLEAGLKAVIMEEFGLFVFVPDYLVDGSYSETTS